MSHAGYLEKKSKEIHLYLSARARPRWIWKTFGSACSGWSIPEDGFSRRKIHEHTATDNGGKNPTRQSGLQ